MVAVTIRAVFPLGQLNAHGAAGPEWPPAPARLAAAILASAHAQDATVVRAARDVFTWPAPRVDAPPAAARRHVLRYVPQNANITATSSHGDLKASISLKLKGHDSPEDGHLLDASSPVVFRWDDVVVADRDALERAVRAVPYLGRPTSPVVLHLTLGDEPTDRPDTYERWEPHTAGRTELRVATPELLDALDFVHETRVVAGYHGLHPEPGVRPTSRYMHVTGRAVPVPAQLASVRAATAALEAVAVYAPTTPVPGDDAATVLQQLAATLNGGLTPVLHTTGRHADGRLLSVLTGARLRPLQVGVATLDGPLTFALAVKPSRVNELVTMRRHLGTSVLWSTVLPVDDDPQTLTDVHHALEALASAAGTRIVAGLSHLAARNPWHPTHPDRVHISIQFEHPVTGPLVITTPSVSVLFAPADPQTGRAA